MAEIYSAVLRESAAARSACLSKISDERAIELLNEVKELEFSKWDKIDFVTIAAIADYYQLDSKEIRGCFKRRNYEAEFKSDGVRTVFLNKIKQSYRLTKNHQKSQQMIIVPARAVVRLAIIFSDDNSVAKQVVELFLEQNEFQFSSKSTEELKLKISLAKAQERAALSHKELFETCQNLAEIDPNLLKMILDYKNGRTVSNRDERDSDNSFVVYSSNDNGSSNGLTFSQF